MSTAFNVWSKANPAPVVTEQEIAEACNRGIKMAQEVNAINDAKRADAGWRQELDELERRLSGMASPEDCRSRVDSLMKAVASETKAYKEKIADAKKALKTGFLSPAEQTHVQKKVENAEHELAEFLKVSGFKVRQAEGLLADSKEWWPKRERLLELRKRAKAIDDAIKV